MTLFSLESLRLDPQPERLRPPEFETAEVRERITAELRRLPKREREAVTAYAGVSDESCRELAMRYGISPQTACNWAVAAIKKLRPKLEGCR